jgi:hypothetical protein
MKINDVYKSEKGRRTLSQVTLTRSFSPTAKYLKDIELSYDIKRRKMSKLKKNQVIITNRLTTMCV